MTDLEKAARQALEALEKLEKERRWLEGPVQYLDEAITALRRALEQPAQHSCYCPNCEALSKELQRLRALVRAQQITIDKLEAQQEPVRDMPHGWVTNWPSPNGGTKPVYHASAIKPKYGEELDGKLTMYPVYTSPQAREPLTDEQIDALELPPSGTATVRDLVRIIEAAHGIKGHT